MKSFIFRLLQFPDRLLYWFFRCIFPLDKRLIIFEAAKGEMNDSSLELYNFLKQNGDYRFVWMVRHPSRYSPNEQTIFVNRFHRAFNIRAVYYYAKAAFSFYTHTTSSIKYKRRGQTVVFFGHGYAYKGNKGHGSNYHNFDYALSIGEAANITQASFIGCSPDKMLPLGLPRNDLLVRSKSNGSSCPWNKGFKKVIIWMPTFRESRMNHLSEKHCATETGLPLIAESASLDQFNAFLNKRNICILLKPHPIQTQKSAFKEHRSNIIVVNDEDIAHAGLMLYEMVAQSDALLTDYSSVAADYLLLDKPIGFILSDMEKYKKDRGFVMEDPTTVMPGHHIYSIEDLQGFINDLCDGIDKYQPARHKTTQQLHAALKGNSCELIRNYFHL